ncbi:MAG TPA: KH domain-containing protein [Pyrinomonadaceae bacterium]|nr:KH domain-containing protein [Pyrinomonadaceae bacterium]
MREAVEMIVRALVDDVEAVDVREVKREGATLIEVRVGPNDMGKIIGRQGRTVRALRSLAHAAGLKRKHRFVLEIVE